MIGLLNELTLTLNGLTLSPRRSSLTITRSRQIKHDRKSFTIIAAGAFRGQSTGGKGISRRAISPLEIGRIGSCASAPFQAVHIFNSKIDMTALTTFTKSSKRSASVTAAAPNALVDTEMKSNSVENGDNAVNGTSLDNAKILSEVRRHLKEMEIDAIIGKLHYFKKKNDMNYINNYSFPNSVIRTVYLHLGTESKLSNT